MKLTIQPKGILWLGCFLLIISVCSLSSYSHAATNLTYEYDNNGNLIQGDGKYYEYNDANQLVRVRHGDASGPVLAEYFYDYTGQRIKKVENGVTSYYIGKHFEKQVGGTSPGDTSYYFANAEPVAKKAPSGNLYFYHADHLGGTNVITDASGNLVERITYYPFGEIREGGNEKYSFTGKEKDKLTDFYYFEARYYNPEFKHFTQADTVNPDIYDPQGLNRFAYVRNNPVKNIDRDGHNWFDNVKSFYKITIGATAKILGRARELFVLSHVANVTERLSNFASKTLAGLNVFEKVSDTKTFRTETSAQVDTRMDPKLNQGRNEVLNQLRGVENIGSAGLDRIPAGVGAAGSTMLGSHNLTERDAPRMIMDYQKPSNLLDAFDKYQSGFITEEEYRKAEELYNNPTSSPLFPK